MTSQEQKNQARSTDADDEARKESAVEQAKPTDGAPQGDGKVDDPTDIHRSGWLVVFKRAASEFGRDQAADVAAALTYFAVLALFPALLAIVSLLSLIGQDENVVDGMLEILASVAPAETVETISEPVRQITEAPGAGFALAIGVVGALWSASAYVTSFGRGMNRIYNVEEGRGLVKLRGTMLLVTLFSVITLAVMALILVVSGPIAEAVGNLIGLGDTAVFVWDIVKWPILVILGALVIAVLYYFTPNVKQPKFRWVSVGAVVALVVWALATIGFFFYAANFSNYDETYGSLGGVIIFLLWLFISNMALLFGAEIDAELERVRELQAGVKAEYTVQLPLRDTKKIDKKVEAQAKSVLEARTLRETRGQEHKDDDNNADDKNTTNETKD